MAEDAKQYLWINAYSLWNDPDERQDDDDLTFDRHLERSLDQDCGSRANGRTSQLGKDRDDGGTGANADLTWGTIRKRYRHRIPPVPRRRTTDDHVILVEIDRTKANNKQEDVAKRRRDHANRHG